MWWQIAMFKKAVACNSRHAVSSYSLKVNCFIPPIIFRVESISSVEISGGAKGLIYSYTLLYFEIAFLYSLFLKKKLPSSFKAKAVFIIVYSWGSFSCSGTLLSSSWTFAVVISSSTFYSSFSLIYKSSIFYSTVFDSIIFIFNFNFKFDKFFFR